MLPWFEQAPLLPLHGPLQVESAFNRFWSVYPRPTGKIRARKAFDKAIKHTTIDVILESVSWKSRTSQWRKVVGGVRVYVPHPATFLNRGDYADPMPPEMAPPPTPVPLSPESRSAMLDLRASIDHQNHLDAMEELTSGAIYDRFPRLERGSLSVRPCPCWKCRAERGAG